MEIHWSDAKQRFSLTLQYLIIASKCSEIESHLLVLSDIDLFSELMIVSRSPALFITTVLLQITNGLFPRLSVNLSLTQWKGIWAAENGSTFQPWFIPGCRSFRNERKLLGERRKENNLRAAISKYVFLASMDPCFSCKNMSGCS